jgi:hypothetical protein
MYNPFIRLYIVQLLKAPLMTYKKVKKVKLSRHRHAGAKGEIKYSSYSFVYLGTRRGEWSVLCPGSAVTPVPIGQQAGWASELVRKQRLQKKSYALPGI